MSKELEALKRLRQETCPATYNPDFDKEECCDVIEQALLELQAIKEAKPSEAMECIDYIENKLGCLKVECKRINNHRCDDLFIQEHIFTAIKQALLKQLSGSQYTNIAIDEVVMPSETIDYLNQFINEMTSCLENPKQYAKGYDKEIFYKYKHTLETTIKATLLKAEKLEKAWEVVKEKRVNIGNFYYVVFVLKKDYESCKLNNNNIIFNICDTEKEFLTEEEFGLLKEMLE